MDPASQPFVADRGFRHTMAYCLHRRPALFDTNVNPKRARWVPQVVSPMRAPDGRSFPLRTVACSRSSHRVQPQPCRPGVSAQNRCREFLPSPDGEFLAQRYGQSMIFASTTSAYRSPGKRFAVHAALLATAVLGIALISGCSSGADAPTPASPAGDPVVTPTSGVSGGSLSKTGTTADSDGSAAQPDPGVGPGSDTESSDEQTKSTGKSDDADEGAKVPRNPTRAITPVRIRAPGTDS